MQKSYMRLALVDVAKTTKRYTLVGMLGWQDVRQRYRRSALGPFWLTISMGVMIATIGVVFGSIFKTPMVEFFPFLSLGLILWRSEEHTSELQSLMRISYAVFGLQKKIAKYTRTDEEWRHASIRRQYNTHRHRAHRQYMPSS